MGPSPCLDRVCLDVRSGLLRAVLRIMPLPPMLTDYYVIAVFVHAGMRSARYGAIQHQSSISMMQLLTLGRKRRRRGGVRPGDGAEQRPPVMVV